MPTTVPDITVDPLTQTRAERWCLTPDTRIARPEEAPALIQRAGIATLFPVSPEVASLYAAYVGPDVPTESGHSTPTGQVYGWRWVLGRREVAFYAAIVHGKPTWVAWDLLPALLRLRGDTRPVEEQVADGLLSADAHRVADALASNGGTLTTGELRRVAGFETGTGRRDAYLRAIAELDRRLLLGRGFGPPDDTDDRDMRQTLVALRHPDAVAAAAAMDAATATRHLLTAYLSGAVFVRPVVFARHLGLDRPDVEGVLATMVKEGVLERFRPGATSRTATRSRPTATR